MFAYLQACKKQEDSGKHVRAQFNSSADSMVLGRPGPGVQSESTFLCSPELDCVPEIDQLPFECVLLVTRGTLLRCLNKWAEQISSLLVRQLKLQPNWWWVSSRMLASKGQQENSHRAHGLLVKHTMNKAVLVLLCFCTAALSKKPHLPNPCTRRRHA